MLSVATFGVFQWPDVAVFQFKIDYEVQKKKMQVDMKITTMSTAFYDLVTAKCFR